MPSDEHSFPPIPFVNFGALAPFPQDTRVRIGIMGLAYCKLRTSTSEVNFLSHVPDHKLDMLILQGRRKTGPTTVLSLNRIERGNAINISAGDDAIAPATIDTSGPHLLRETINLNHYHGNARPFQVISEKSHPVELDPIRLRLKACSFYTGILTRCSFDLAELDAEGKPGSVLIPRAQFGDVIGGKIKCLPNAPGSLMIDISGPLNSHLRYPLTEMNGEEFVDEFIYDIYFANHCVGSLPGNPLDFHFYYDLLEDFQSLGKMLGLVEPQCPPPDDDDGPSGDVAACNPIVIEPFNW